MDSQEQRELMHAIERANDRLKDIAASVKFSGVVIGFMAFWLLFTRYCS